MNEDRELLNQFRSSQEKNEKIALATIVCIEGSSYRRPGAKMLVTENGTIVGTISGGCLERDLTKRALIAIHSSKSMLVRYDSRLDTEEDISIEAPSLGCEGVIEIFINPQPHAHLNILREVHLEWTAKEYKLDLPNGTIFVDRIQPPVRIVIFGAGSDAIPMARIAMELGWHTTVLDCRSSLSNSKFKFKNVDLFVTCSLDKLKFHLPNTSDFAAIVMTHHFDHDRIILELLNQVRPKYTGLLGPRGRTLRILKELERDGVFIDSSQLFFPLGLDIGGSTPQSVALSAIAEAHAVLSNREGKSLKYRLVSIH